MDAEKLARLQAEMLDRKRQKQEQADARAKALEEKKQERAALLTFGRFAEAAPANAEDMKLSGNS